MSSIDWDQCMRCGRRDDVNNIYYGLCGVCEGKEEERKAGCDALDARSDKEIHRAREEVLSGA